MFADWIRVLSAGLTVNSLMEFPAPLPTGQPFPQLPPGAERSGPAGHSGRLVHQLLPGGDSRHAALRPVHAPLRRLLPAGR